MLERVPVPTRGVIVLAIDIVCLTVHVPARIV